MSALLEAVMMGPELAKVLHDTAALLRFQGELQLTGLDVPASCLRQPGAAPKGLEAASPSGPSGPLQPSMGQPGQSGKASQAAQTSPTSPLSLSIGVADGAARRPADVAGESSTRRVVPGAAGLAAVRERMGQCERCKLSRGRTTIVFGVGAPDARLMFVGEGPGLDEDLQGEPFVGAAGKLLDRMILAMGTKRSSVYIANVVKCRPPRNRDPQPDEVAACEPFLREQIAAVQPEVIVTLGRYAAQCLLRDTTPITRMRGKWRTYEGIALMPTFHPAYLLRNEGEKKAAWVDLQEVMKRLSMPVPSPRSSS